MNFNHPIKACLFSNRKSIVLIQARITQIEIIIFLIKILKLLNVNFIPNLNNVNHTECLV